ncbi:MAG: phytanoyl-CoA dioxygenase family protein [Gammaproteobacteria bacterium]|nr:phytanoyl-CoA dioxygenase family protein [Gammaproteobacteria bacterium]MDH3374782.1 phytanoyl-CoA dioxygenase family protein [Gammaproteobacteria bacterium]MDH3408329.1 phytanoyl-CoA dioxygenase family protein [Gammaproteobacteria bacterium]MDH3551388.1 phytanoyl-CoA dioxygenase family protein [Gammaproteobacteria bacterium]
MNKLLPTFAAPPDGRLSAEMLSAFADDGVIVLREFVTVEACAALRQRALELVAAFDPAEVRSVFSTTRQEQLGDSYFIESGDKIRFFLENGAFNDAGELRQAKEHSLNKMGHAMHDLDPAFDRFSRTLKLANAAASLGFEDPVILQSMYIFKPPRIGGEVVCHQDSTYIYTEPESCIGFWFALEDATTENGCMYFIPGAHKSPLKKRNYRQANGTLVTETLDDTPWPEDQKVAAPAPAGSLVIFDGRAPHLSGPNLSDKSRHAYTLHVIDRRCHYPAENWLQRSDELPLRGFDA